MRWKDNGRALHKHISLVQWDLTNQEDRSSMLAAISWCMAGHHDSLILQQGRWLEH